MKTLDTLTLAFGKDFEHQIAQFVVAQKLLPKASDIQSNRFLTRSVLPHVKKLSALFNREEKDQASSLEPYWKESSNPKNLRLAYFLYFMPSNLYRVASIWAELARLGFEWKADSFRGIEFGSGPASGACGIAAGERYASLGLPAEGEWALIEQDQASLQLGAGWLENYLSYLNKVPIPSIDNKIQPNSKDQNRNSDQTEINPTFDLSRNSDSDSPDPKTKPAPDLTQNFSHRELEWTIKPFHRKVDVSEGFLPRTAPKFNLWLMSFYLNELDLNAPDLASLLVRAWDKHLQDEGLIILVEPALKLQSRRLLELRKEILKIQEGKNDLKILTPCLGHQLCGALQNPEDWCHEEVTWWRPPYFKKIDQLAGLDRKTLPFSYLVIAKSKRSREELLPKLATSTQERRERLVSPAHAEGRDFEFFLCGQTGKRRVRYRPTGESDPAAHPQRGNILMDPEIRGDRNSGRVASLRDCL